MNRSLDALAELKASELDSKPFGPGGEQAIPRLHEPPPQPPQFPRPDWQAEAAERARVAERARTEHVQHELEQLAEAEHHPAEPAPRRRRWLR